MIVRNNFSHSLSRIIIQFQGFLSIRRRKWSVKISSTVFSLLFISKRRILGVPVVLSSNSKDFHRYRAEDIPRKFFATSQSHYRPISKIFTDTEPKIVHKISRTVFSPLIISDRSFAAIFVSLLGDLASHNRSDPRIRRFPLKIAAKGLGFYANKANGCLF